MSRVDDEFEQLGTELSQAAARVDCTPVEYRSGLRGIIETLKADIAASEETSGDEDHDD